MRPSLALLAVLALSSSLGCEEAVAPEDSGTGRDAPVSLRDAATRDARVDSSRQNVSPDPEGTGATLTASKSQVCPGECVELLASPGEGAGAVSYRWANELAEGAGPVHVCPQVDTTYEVAIRHGAGSVGEFSAPASEVSRSVTVRVAGDCQAQTPGPEIHDSARELCRAHIVVGDGDSTWWQEPKGHDLYFGSNWFGPALVHFLPSGGMRVAAVYFGKLSAGPIALASEPFASFVIELDATCQPVSAVQFAPQGQASLLIAALAIDPQGNTIIAGTVNGPYDLGDGPVGFVATGAAGEYAGDPTGWLAKLDPQGRVLWSRRLFGGLPTAVRADGEGNIVLLAYYSPTQGPVDLGSGPIVVEFPDTLLAKFDPSGKNLWSQRAPAGQRFDVGPDGEIATTSVFYPRTSGDAPADTRLALLDGNGRELWQQTEHFDAAVNSASVAIGRGGRIVQQVEVSSDTSAAGAWPNARVLTTAYDPDGGRLWRQQADAPNQLAKIVNDGLSVDRWGSVASASRFHGPLEFGASTSNNQSAYDDLYVSLHDASGKPRWAFPLMANYADQCLFAGIDADDAGNIAVSAIIFSTALTSPTREMLVVKLAQ